MAYKYLFGPVPSRRLGRSLGVDLVPLKVCTLDCIYCEVSATNNLTLERREYVPIDLVLQELADFLSGNPELDYITFSGSGEPTLNSGIGQVVSWVKKKYPQYRLALITNGTLFYQADLREQVRNVDLLLPSLDVVSAEGFAKLNRPHPGLNIDAIIDGLAAFKSNFLGTMWLEIFISPGINDTPEELALLKDACEKIAPDLVQLNSLDRPGVVPGLYSVSREKMEEIARFLEPLPVEVIARFRCVEHDLNENKDYTEQVLEILGRRPCTVEDLSASLGATVAAIEATLQPLLAATQIRSIKEGRGFFYALVRKDEDI